MLGFVICFSFGGLLSLSALGSLPSLLLGNPGAACSLSITHEQRSAALRCAALLQPCRSL